MTRHQGPKCSGSGPSGQPACFSTMVAPDDFSMSAADCLLPHRVPAPEYLALHNIPRDYAAAMRARWRPQIPHGTQVDITGARPPQWLAENRDNPLRDWDGRGHISRSRYIHHRAK
jgi:hypothetical protein